MGTTLHGCVVDKNDVPVSRVVLVISRETDKIVATGLSDAANNGEFTIPMMNNKQVIVMVKGTGGGSKQVVRLCGTIRDRVRIAEKWHTQKT